MAYFLFFSQRHKKATSAAISASSFPGSVTSATASRAYSSASSSASFAAFHIEDFSDVSDQPIGTGSHKKVFSATFTGSITAVLQAGVRVALLYFKVDVVPNLEELKVMTQIWAPHLAKFYGTVQQPSANDTRLCLVSDLAPLGSLLHFFEQAEKDELDVSLSHKLVMAQQAGNGLSVLHTHHLIHADVAARNVLVYAFDADNHHGTLVKLCDYGMVRERSKYTDVSASIPDGAATGQSLLLSPKWASWESLNKDRFYCASDVWAFAVLIWELLTECDEPYPGLDPTIPTIIAHLSQGHRLQRPEGCSDALWTVVSECWCENHRDRPELHKVLARLSCTWST